MRETLQNLALILIFSAVLEALLPPSAGKRAFHILAAVVIFSVLVSGFKAFDFSALDPEALFPEKEELSELAEKSSEESLLLAAEIGWKTSALDALKVAKIKAADAEAVCAAEDGRAVLQKLTVRGVSKESEEAARRVLAELSGEEALVHIVTEESS